MSLKQGILKSRQLNFFLIAVLLLLGASLLYFLYYRQRSSSSLYVEVTLTRPQNFPILNVSYNWLPYWLANAVKIGDKEQSLLGRTNAVILDKDSFEGTNYGKYVSLLLLVNAIKDRSGTYLFKNKPLTVGSLLDLKFTTAQVNGIVTSVGIEKPIYDYKYLTIVVSDKATDKWITEKLTAGSQIKDEKDQTLAKIISKKETTQGPVGVPLFDPALGRSVTTIDTSKINLELTLDVKVKKVEDLYYFAETQKVKLGEQIYLPFKETSQYFVITSIVSPKD